MPGRVDVRAVVVRIGVGNRLDALVAGGAAVWVDAAPAKDRERLAELVLLRVVDQVAGDHDRLRPEGVQRAHRRLEHLARERLLRPKRARERRAEPVEYLQSRRRLLVDD